MKNLSNMKNLIYLFLCFSTVSGSGYLFMQFYPDVARYALWGVVALSVSGILAVFFRKLMLRYWKIDKLISNQEEIIKQLSERNEKRSKAPDM
jgi:hypothetical protein